MTRKSSVLTGLTAASLALASGLAFAAGQYRPGIGDTEIKARNTVPHNCMASSDGPTSMSKPLVISVPHHLSRREALRRLKSGLAAIERDYAFIFTVQEQTWIDYHLQFRISVLGQAACGSIDVTNHQVHLEAFLPWLLAQLAEAAEPIIRRQGALMLETK